MKFEIQKFIIVKMKLNVATNPLLLRKLSQALTDSFTFFYFQSNWHSSEEKGNTKHLLLSYSSHIVLNPRHKVTLYAHCRNPYEQWIYYIAKKLSSELSHEKKHFLSFPPLTRSTKSLNYEFIHSSPSTYVSQDHIFIPLLLFFIAFEAISFSNTRVGLLLARQRLIRSVTLCQVRCSSWMVTKAKCQRTWRSKN